MAKLIITCLLLVFFVCLTACDDAVREPDPPRVLTVREWLDLGDVVSLEQMQAIHRRLQRDGKLLGQGCGVTTDSNGKFCGYCVSYYHIVQPGVDEDRRLSMGYASGGYPGITHLSGKGFRYIFVDGQYVLHSEQLQSK